MRKRSKLPGAMRLATSATLALASAGALTGALVLGSAQAAGASTLSGTIPYSCPISVSGSVVTTPTLDIGVTATAPASVAPGGSITLTGVSTSTTVPATLVTELVSLLHVTSFGGTVVTFDFNATGATPATVNGAPSGSGATFSVKVQTGHPATIVVPTTGPETVGPWTAGQSGNVTIQPGNVVITTKVGASTASINCTSSSVPATEVASIAISSSGSSSPTTVPTTHTGEPWAGWPYWMVVGLAGVVGLGAMERAVRIRRRRA
jgi:hypothetical protein